jgi:hypothetical protein
MVFPGSIGTERPAVEMKTRHYWNGRNGFAFILLFGSFVKVSNIHRVSNKLQVRRSKKVEDRT